MCTVSVTQLVPVGISWLFCVLECACLCVFVHIVHCSSKTYTHTPDIWSDSELQNLNGSKVGLLLLTG